jgi:hypothetical protein
MGTVWNGCQLWQCNRHVDAPIVVVNERAQVFWSGGRVHICPQPAVLIGTIGFAEQNNGHQLTRYKLISLLLKQRPGIKPRF